VSPRGPDRNTLTQWRLAAKDPPERPAHDRATDRVAHGAADRLADAAGDLAGDPVGHRAGDFACDQLACGEPLAARAVGAEDRAEHVADAAEQAATLLRRRVLSLLRR